MQLWGSTFTTHNSNTVQQAPSTVTVSGKATLFHSSDHVILASTLAATSRVYAALSWPPCPFQLSKACVHLAQSACTTPSLSELPL